MTRRSTDRPRLVDSSTPIGIRPLVEAIDALARSRGMTTHRVAYKKNDKGEHVVAVIFTTFPS